MTTPYRIIAACALLPFLVSCATPTVTFALDDDDQQRRRRAPQPVPEPTEPPADLEAPDAEAIAAAIDRGLLALMGMEEPDDPGQWPYEGVYRVQGQIPIGYRVGGTSICCMAMTQHPDYAENEELQSAVARGIAFVCSSRNHPKMSATDYNAGYDVRGWGYIYAVQFLTSLEQRGLVPDNLERSVQTNRRRYIRMLESIEIPRAGGWNYARPAGKDTPGNASPFMTATALHALFDAKALGDSVDRRVIERALDALERSEYASGAMAYSGDARDDRTGGLPGAVGRTASAVVALHRAGRVDTDAVQAAVENFIKHWKWLEVRRKQTGTHVAPYGVAPYYFFFAHHAAAQAVECLPEETRPGYRDQINALLFHVQDPDGTWNDRVFARSANYGTAMACLALRMPDTGPPARYAPGNRPIDDDRPAPAPTELR